MQEVQNTSISWIKQGCYIDTRDKQGQWKVALIMNVTKTHIRIRYDGWSAKFDQNFAINSANIKPFRSVTRGYTGPIQSPGIRQHFAFSQSFHKETYLAQLEEYLNNIQNKSQFQIYQFIRGSHFCWIDYLMTLTYKTLSEMTLVYQYFIKHFKLIEIYFKNFLLSNSIDCWFKGVANQEKMQVNQSKQAFAKCIYQIMETAYYIMQGNPQRTKNFFKANQSLISQVILGFQSHADYLSNSLNSLDIYQLFQQVIVKIANDENSFIKLSFMTALTKFFYTLQKTIKDKQKKKQITQKLCLVNLRECEKMNQIAVKQQQFEIEKIYGLNKLFLSRYSWKTEMLAGFQMINLKVWRSLILSQKLQRKIKGINKLKTYYNYLAGSQGKRQTLMIYNTKQIADKQIRKLQIINAIFCQNQHHEIIKKGCQLILQMYKLQGITINQLQIIWKSCRPRLEAVRKVMYLFFQSICKQLTAKQLSSVVKWIIQQNMNQQIDKNFFYSFFRQTIISSKQDKIPTLKTLFEYAQKRLFQNKQQLKSFAQLITMQKCAKLGFLKQYSNKFINMISNKQSNQNSIFCIKIINLFYEEATKTKQLQLDTSCFHTVYQYLVNNLALNIRKQNTVQYNFKRQKISQLLKLLENLSNQFDFQTEIFTTIWNLFNKEQNTQFREQEFLPWIIQTNHTGALRIQTQTINKCLKQPKIKRQLFNKLFKDHKQYDFVNMSDMEFKIFKKFQIQVNKDDNVLEERVDYLSGIHYFRVSQKVDVVNGLKQLWVILVNCRNFSVSKKVIRLIKQFYLNYKSQVDIQFRKRKLQQLLIKINQYILTDGFKKSNIRIIKNMLYLLYQVIATIKQIFKGHYQYSFYYHHKAKRNIKIFKDDKQIKDIQVHLNDSVKSLKNYISKELNIPLYNFKLFKNVVSYKKSSDDGNDIPSDQASAGASSHTQVFSKSSFTRVYHLQQIPNQLFYAPISCLMLGQHESKIMVVQRNNQLYQLLCRYVCQKMSEYLLKILGDTQTFTKQSSQLAYHILIQIPSNLPAFQVINNLISQLKTKNKEGQKQSQSQNQINISCQSINFRMYFCKNINRLKDQQFCQFLSQDNIKLYENIFKEISKQIVESQQIQLIIQAMSLTKRALNKGLIHQNIFSVENVFVCMINLIQFIIGPKQTQQFRKQQRSELMYLQQKLFTDCWSIIQLMHKQKQQIIDTIVQSDYFQKLAVYVFKNMHRKQFAEIMASRFQKYFRFVERQMKIKLNQVTQDIICCVIFDVLYYDVIKIQNKKNTPFFRIIKDFILYSNDKTITKLFTKNKNEQSQSFWLHCINTIKQQSDLCPDTNSQKDNIVLSGHLLILQSLIRKNPSAVDLNICKLILYSCLCYKQGETISQDVKCVTKNSIQYALSVLFAICQSDQNLLVFIVSQLRKYQQTQYWRTPQFWNINAQIQLKSQTGYVGLQNPGCICYLNSFTQTLFMNQQFRNRVINFSAIQQNKDYSLLKQLRKIFLNLQYSSQKYLNPVPFTLTIKNNQDKPMIKIFQQMDIQQYSSILFDKIQKLLPKDQDFVKEIFGGAYSNDIISQECKHSSQRQQNFLSMQLDVKPNLEESLRVLVKQQILQGQNAYFCQSCNRKVKAIKRMSIKKLPNYLIICLKRFQYNFQLDQKVKINSYCQFSRQISLQSYSQQHLNMNQQQIRQQQQGETETQSLPHQYFDYRLKGVIIHTGSSDSGHYYTLIETQNNKWLQFNDSIVCQFDIQRLADQAFGSQQPMHNKYKNAYMLIYQRKKKIVNKNQSQKMQIQNPLKFSSPQVQNIYNQIRVHNKQIRTFHMMFSQQYIRFIQHIMIHIQNQNKAFANHLPLKQQNDNNVYNVYSDGNQKQDGQYTVELKNNYRNETILEMLKFYFEYIMFIRSRQINSKYFIQCLNQFMSYVSSQFSIPILDYVIRQFSQTLLVEQFFVEISFREKLLIISRFICQIVMKRLRFAKNNLGKQLTFLIMKLIQSFMIVIIQNGNCVNQLIYIIRNIAEQNQQLRKMFQKIDIMGSLYQILFGLNQNQSSKYNKIQTLRKQILYIVKSSDSSQQKYDEKSQSQMQQQYAYYNLYEISTVKRTGKCALKLQSPPQAWNYLYYIYHLQCQEFRNAQKQCSDNQQQICQIPYLTTLQIRRSNMQQQFLKLKQTRISHVIQQCYGFKSMISLSLFLCQLIRQRPNITEKIINVVKKGLKVLQATKFRAFLILIYHMANLYDSHSEERNQLIVRVLYLSLVQNTKFFSQTDVIHQWIIKMATVSQGFYESIISSQEGSYLIHQVLSKLQSFKKPGAQLLKKHRNPSYERLNYQLHGLVVSGQLNDYENLYLYKKKFFEMLNLQNPPPYQSINAHDLPIYKQPNYYQIIHRIKPGDFVYMFIIKKWVKVLVISNKFGFVKAHRIIKYPQNLNVALGMQLNDKYEKKKKQHEKTIKMRIKDFIISLPQNYKIDDEQLVIFQNEQKIKYCGSTSSITKHLQKVKNHKDQPSQQQYKQNMMNQQKYQQGHNHKKLNIFTIEQAQQNTSSNNKKNIKEKDQIQQNGNIYQNSAQTTNLSTIQAHNSNSQQSNSQQMVNEQNTPSSDISYQSQNQ